ncbi:hypothetical protein F0Q45_15080 [Mycobacterium simiae]|uniref:Uncharacterized protein n=2 Tax=Mycobacterium simiae TaxID=1784 RepID=A0A5B1BMW9_MYCSI|nr:hypothetical protein F0Q45_15080 [Mycobacterium simiae]
MPPIEAWLRQQLRESAIEIRRLAYTLPDGLGEHALLRLSEQLSTSAEQHLGAPSSVLTDLAPMQ